MRIPKSLALALFTAIILNFSCSGDQNSENNEQTEEIYNLIQNVQEAVDSYFTIEEDGGFLRSTYTGEYTEPFIGHVYEFVITKKTEYMEEFNYLTRVSYSEESGSISIVDRDFMMFTTIEDMDGWIDKRLKLNDAKSVN